MKEMIERRIPLIQNILIINFFRGGRWLEGYLSTIVLIIF